MYSVKNTFSSEQEIKKSKFIAYICAYDEFEELHARLKTEHPKAVHIVWAYRYMNKYMQIVENQSDDGEPKGTSGLPSLNALRGAALVDTAVFIVRYFGGIKLGTGGLVRAYSSSVNLAIDMADLVEFEIKDECKFFVPFTLISRFEHFFDKNSLKLQTQFSENGAVMSAKFSLKEFDGFYEFVREFLINGVWFEALPIFSRAKFI